MVLFSSVKCLRRDNLSHNRIFKLFRIIQRFHRFNGNLFLIIIMKKYSRTVLGSNISAHHMVTPVRPAAGSNVRASVSGFFLREPLPEAQ